MSSKQAFTLIELLVVIAIIALLMGILLPVLGRAREQAKVVVVNAELYQIGLALEMYMEDNNRKHPPTREDCMTGEHYHQLPKELVRYRYLPKPSRGTYMSTVMEDRFNRGYTYKYQAVGEVIRDRNIIHTIMRAKLWVPDGFPYLDGKDGQWYDCPQHSPVTWVIFSQGPKFDWWQMKKLKYPIPKETWYNPKTRSGVIVRMQLKKGRYIGSFEDN